MLPPTLSASWSLTRLEATAQGELRELNGLLQNLSNPMLLTHAFARREAVQSSRIEGTTTDYRGLLEFEATGGVGAANPDAEEVLNYVTALHRGMELLQDLPLCLRIVREMHRMLLADVRGNSASPGELRRLPVWIGGRTPAEARYVPPPADELPPLLSNWEQFLHAPSEFPLLTRIAIAHYQFEAIHPFLDGNGRTGRLLMLLHLVQDQVLSFPALDLSDYIKRNRQTYYDLLTGVSMSGDWQAWLEFLLTGFAEQASRARFLAQELLALRKGYQVLLQTQTRAGLAYEIVDQLFESPWISIPSMAKITGKSYNAVKEHTLRLVELGILTESPTHTRERVYFANGIIQVLEPAPS